MKEIDLRALLIDNLKNETSGMATIKSLVENSSITDRDFNNKYEWTSAKATNYIESVMLNIEMHEIVLFKYENCYYICNGMNRIKTLRKFINNELKLSVKGLEKYKSLTNMKFKDLDKDYQEKFLNNIYLRTITYEYIDGNNINHQLTKEESREIQKFLYHIYNNCIKLELTEIQRAEYSNEYINQYLKSKMLNDGIFLKKLESLYFCSNKSQKIDSILVNIRSFLCTTYNSINDIKKYYTTSDRINNLYLKSIENLDSNQVVRDFLITIDIMYNMQQLKIWKEHEELHNKYFIETIYWLLSIIKKDNLLSMTRLPIESMIDYACKHKELFIISNRFSRKQFVRRIEFIAKYAEKYLGINMKKYIEGEKEYSYLNNVLPEQKYSFTPLPSNTIKLSDFLIELQEGNYDLFPDIQRREVMNKKEASEIIQTILLGIKIPPILVYEKNVNGKIIKSVTDGKQRVLSLIGFLGITFKNIKGEECNSKKNNFALQNLKILTELNGQTYNGINRTKMLEEKYKRKILDYDLGIVVANEKDAINFDDREHFVRLNGSFKKKPQFNTWYSIFDTEVLETIKNIALKHKDKIFSKNENDNNNIIIRLAYLESEYKNKQDLKSKVSVSEIETWLVKLENTKAELIKNNNDEPIKIMRKKYINAINEMDCKLSYIEKWIKEKKLNIFEIFNQKNKNSKPKQFICLYQLLKNISPNTLYSRSEEIVSILNNFYKEIKNNLNQKEIVKLIEFYKTKIDILDDNLRIDANKYVNKMR